MGAEFDVIVVGSGINGMVAAAELARAGRSVLLVERNDRLGGFIASEQRTVPGYVHDTYSSWHPLFLAGPAYASLGEQLHAHGLVYRNTDTWAAASVADDGRVSLAHRDPVRTAEGFEHDADRAAYLSMLDKIGENMAAINGFLGSELRSWALLRHGAKLINTGGVRGAEGWLRQLATSGRSFCRREFQGREVDHLFAPWLLHAGLGPDHASGGLMTGLLAAGLHGAGLPVVEGGADNFVTAFAKLMDSLGVQVRTDTEVERIMIEDGRAIGVISGGRVFRARHGVLASVAPSDLYGHLLPPSAVKPHLARQAAQFRYGRAAMQIHVALSAPLQWRDERLADFPIVHLTDGSASTGIACAEAEAGLLPRRPTVVVGRQYLLDETRVPTGAASLWLQLQELPFDPVGDSAGELDTSGGWTRELAEGYAQRVFDRLDAHAPGVRDLVCAVDIISPPELTAHNPGSAQGDPYGGSTELDQNYLWRPLPSAGSHATSIPGLWHIGASTHPGPGMGGGSGHAAATALLKRAR
ncbi:phytoene desaturase family protein [Saccharopolyspora flava]|uniref:Pyridine nucleotide-disulfide oxidoreductase domain-containing protein 2 n=1 Tax=Saccharopolyspora flava TaxID=95161 RepID=A0A1I6SNA7_9PSEU|nr:NAD(P)/FAD-dependent oxidoreductase [Saccharopolyspora flava]SFS78288.1 Phytoene dehydrogenase-related protein [Saccharopolyspora flava]